MTLRLVIEKVCLKWWGPQLSNLAVVKSGTSGLADSMESAILAWEAERDCRLQQIIALKEAGMNPCLRDASQACNNWNLQLSPEAGHLIDFDGATLEDVLKEACAIYLSTKEATT